MTIILKSKLLKEIEKDILLQSFDLSKNNSKLAEKHSLSRERIRQLSEKLLYYTETIQSTKQTLNYSFDINLKVLNNNFYKLSLQPIDNECTLTFLRHDLHTMAK